MAISIACPSCKQPFGLPPSFGGGRATCPNPKCGKTFYAPAPAGAADAPARPAAGSRSGRVRAYVPKPQPASHIPPNMYASPAFVAGGAVVVLLYGMVLFAALSSQRRDAEAAYDVPEPAPTLAYHDPSPASDVQAVPAPEPEHAPQPKPAPKPDEPPKSSVAPTPAPKPSVEPPSAPPPPPPPPPTEPPSPAPSPAAPKPAAPAAKPLTPEPAPRAVALNTEGNKLAGAPGIPTVDGPTFKGLAPWADPQKSVKARREDGAIVLAVPAGIHILSPQLKHKDAPMSLAEVTGDFEVEVQVAGGIRPGSKPLSEAPLPIAFQGAGLVIWQDGDNYLRFERAAMSGPSQPLVQKVMIEVCRDGKPGSYVYKDTSDRAVYLRATRKADELECAYSPDGKAWIVIKKSSIALFSDKVYVGIAASNLSPKPFSPRFEDFTLERGSGKHAAR